MLSWYIWVKPVFSDIDKLLQLFFQGQAVAQLCSTVPNVTVFGIASYFKHEAIKDSVTHLFDRNADYIQEVKK